MENERKNLKVRIAEFSQKVDVVTSVVALGGSAIGIIPIGFTVAFLGFNLLTYYAAEKIKENKQSPNRQFSARTAPTN